ncbi:hypothetical protein C8Q77DRAFT_1157283 [Trametes polyzona]|nr:hypothetical protein C8Q77DRAFT_1157283 [Trametes polyzona]
MGPTANGKDRITLNVQQLGRDEPLMLAVTATGPSRNIEITIGQTSASNVQKIGGDHGGVTVSLEADVDPSYQPLSPVAKARAMDPRIPSLSPESGTRQALRRPPSSVTLGRPGAPTNGVGQSRAWIPTKRRMNDSDSEESLTEPDSEEGEAAEWKHYARHVYKRQQLLEKALAARRAEEETSPKRVGAAGGSTAARVVKLPGQN